MLKIPEVDDVDIAFGGYPDEFFEQALQAAPEEFHGFHAKTEWNEIISYWFFNGLNEKVEFYPKDGVDAKKALRIISAIMGSFKPKHEHKETVCAYLLSEWFDKIKKWKK